MKLRWEITSFSQKEGESLYEAWERLNEMHKSCPPHGLRWLIIETFYIGLHDTPKVMVNASAGSILLNKSVEDVFSLLDDMEQNECQWLDERSTPEIGDKYDDIFFNKISSIVESLSHEINKMGENVVMFSIEIKKCLSIIRQMTSIHFEFKNLEESVMKKFDEIISRMTRLKHVPPIPSSQDHLNVVSLWFEKQLEEAKNKEMKKSDDEENIKTQQTNERL